MTKLTENIKRMLNALAYANAGENLSAREKAIYLSKPEPVIAVMAEPVVAGSAQKQVALYMGSELSADVMNYVMQTCARLNHGLTVLTFQPEFHAQALLSPHKEALAAAGITLRLEILAGDPLNGLARYLRRHPAVAFLACNESGFLGRGLLNGTQRQDVLPVPVVLVASNANKAQVAQPSKTAPSTRAA